MRRWKFLIVLGSAAAALAVGLGAQAQTEHTDLVALLTTAWGAIS
jgi:hypothetical protein